MMTLRLKSEPISEEEEEGEPTPSSRSGEEPAKKSTRVDLGNGSEVVYMPRFLSSDESWRFYNYLNSRIPWTRPTIRVFGRSCLQHRDTCYVANAGLTDLVYSGYQPHAYSWDDYPLLKEILEAVHNVLPGSKFNSLLLNRYKGGSDYVGWHSDDEKLYGSAPEIASVSFGCEREFFLKKKPSKTSQARRPDDGPVRKRSRIGSDAAQHTFVLKHGSLLVMRGYTQRDWIHSVPKRAKAEGVRINLTFRRIVS
ncbi:DNA oxidative demethylase ALKBH2-like [Rhodamnia argentea]|uniref:DNA oxidative demethylase ALKBH2-like n=1 Tax=Rhodamnia argentea TaxID=178133 RepID=A0A8B8PF23_9MYRT|nr:DNA oxidative demethylase ALKBH2-like [Rhodamnia argentea]